MSLPLLTDGIAQKIQLVQKQMKKDDVDAWLIIDHRGKNPVAKKLLGALGPATRQYLIIVAASGEKMIIRPLIEAEHLDALCSDQVEVFTYRGVDELKKMLGAFNFSRVAVDIDAENPETDLVPAGRLQLLRTAFSSQGKRVRVVSSRDYLQILEAVLDSSQLGAHRRSASMCSTIIEEAFEYVRRQLQRGEYVSELDTARFIIERFQQENLIAEMPPLVAAGPNTANPHHQPGDAQIKPNMLLLIDLWARYDIYADMTWMGYTGKSVPIKYSNLFDVLLEGQNAGIQKIKPGRRGYEVDRAVRHAITSHGLGAFFPHRTGHSIDSDVHGKGANLDGFEVKETRRLLSGLVVSVEPGVYIPKEYGLRTEVNVIVGPFPEVTTKRQDHILCLEELHR